MNTLKQFNAQNGVFKDNNSFDENNFEKHGEYPVATRYSEWSYEKKPVTRVTPQNSTDLSEQQILNSEPYVNNINIKNHDSRWKADGFLTTPYNEIYNMVVISDFP